ncbi:MAG: tetratricopeptide repeat protein [Lewinellaceae bacterium]|nr:tetratricopeptide repeat protein [Lewinellaceae bacterium]MCB9296422.1 tetratricopeptide repeat protein [Lewinellaceae bacterium]
MNRKIFFAILASILANLPSLGQSGGVDSLEQLLETSLEPAIKQKVLSELAFLYLQSDPGGAALIARQGIDLARKRSDYEALGEAANTLAQAFLSTNKLDSAQLVIDPVLPQLEQQGLTEAAATLNMTRGAAFFRASDLPNAAACFERSARLYAEAGSPKEEGALLNLGTVLIGSEELARAEPIFQKLVKSEAPVNRFNALINLGNMYGFRGELRQSVQYFEEALDLGRKSGFNVATVQLNLGISYEKMGDYDRAISYYQEAFAAYSKLEARREMAKVLYNLGYLYAEQGAPDRALKEIEKAEALLDAGNLQEWLELYTAKHEILQRKGDYRAAYGALQKAYAYRDSLFSVERAQAVDEIETRYQTEKTALENQNLQQENELQAVRNRNQRRWLASVVAGLAVLAFLAALLFYQRQKLRQANRRLAEQNAREELLNRELRHRIKNNLGLANSLMRMQVRRLAHPEARQALQEAESRLAAMSMLHRRLNQGPHAGITIGIRDYLEELAFHLKQAFDGAGTSPEIEVQSPEMQVDAEAAMRIGLIVNELATNSFKHAFKTQPSPLINIVFTNLDNGQYQLNYRDNGSGLPAEFQLGRQESMGLRLIDTLVKQLDGSMELSGKEDGLHFNLRLQASAAA